jgi:adenylylsulfate kinase
MKKRLNVKEKRTRSIIKAVSWRIFASVITMMLIYAFTGKAALSLGIGAFEITSKLIMYYAHERVWDNIGWGKKAYKER